MMIVAILSLPLIFIENPRSASPVAPVCHGPALTPAGTREAPEVRPLDDQPPARGIKAVVRTIDGCSTPIVVSAEVGTPRR